MVRDPYPHLVVENALPPEVADTLLAEMPPLEVLARGARPGSNQRLPLPTADAMADPRISKAWKWALSAVNDDPQGLLDWVVGNLGADILAAYPDFEARFGPLRALKAVPRSRPNRRRDEVGFDAQIVANSPARTDGTRVRGPHLDIPEKLVSALLYLRAPEDDSTGAELELFEPEVDELVFDRFHGLPQGVVRHVRTYPYRHNLLVFSINTPRSIHGVSPRSRTAHPRYHINVVGEMAEPLFKIPTAALGWRDVLGAVSRRLAAR